MNASEENLNVFIYMVFYLSEYRYKQMIYFWFFCMCWVNDYKADPMWAAFTALRYKDQRLLISAREVCLPISLRLTDSVKHGE